MIKKILSVFIVCFTVNCFSQSYMNGVVNSAPLKIFTKAKTPDEFTGSPYYDDSFLPAKIDDGEHTMDAFVRYNAVEDVVEVKIKRNTDEINVLPKLKKIRYVLNDYKIFIDEFVNEDGESINGYMLDYYTDKGIRFLARPEPDVIEAQPARTGYDKDKPAHLDVEMVYYIQKDGARLKEVRLKEKDFKKLFSDKPKMIPYFKDNKIKDGKDVVRMLEYYSS
ncbi:hypothetical protein [Zunongwangia pacifica]|uniref:Uncharacterized protein n=1 Tax=Zunongwangia pacifica TaxID=2911062 RepID=A0A9X1ZV80_9FLAO|nr:hypothetical protein [Zunongwangia pacifica]MCL6220746.1 hypothetical protein [Zunongwangia pacifica]